MTRHEFKAHERQLTLNAVEREVRSCIQSEVAKKDKKLTGCWVSPSGARLGRVV